MKRYIPLCLLLLLLCGCAKEEITPTVENTTAPVETQPEDAYIPNSDIEAISEGALKQYDLDKNLSWILPFGDSVLAISVADSTVFTVLSGENGTIKAETEVSVKLEDADCQVVPGGIVYYDRGVKQAVFLDAALQETKRLQLPSDISGKPAVSQTGSEIFYCVGQTVYAMNTTQKTVRPVRTNTCKEQTLLGCYLDGTVVACRILDAADTWNTLYISGVDGKLWHKDNGVQKVYSHGDTFFALRADGIVNQYIYGKTTDSALPVQMNFAAQSAFGALETGGVIGQAKTENGYRLSFYNMKKSAAVNLPQEWEVISVAAEAENIWLLTKNGKLLQWDLKKSAVTEDTDYFGTIYTSEAPDTAGLKACAKRGDEIGSKYGVVVRVWERALVSNDNYDIEVEYQTDAINRTLDELETVLALFPDRFLRKSVTGGIRICIVRSIDGEQKSAYHWTLGDPFVVISAGMDVKQAFLDAFSYIVDIHILGNSSDVDNWADLNPTGFRYGMENTVMAYLEGDTRAFADRKGMTSITDDRASIFRFAVEPDNAEMFRAEIMQKKLTMLCVAIRDAWRLENSEETFLWEQYLHEPIAHKKT